MPPYRTMHGLQEHLFLEPPDAYAMPRNATLQTRTRAIVFSDITCPFLLRIEIVPRYGELVCNHITGLYHVLQAFSQNIIYQNVRIFCPKSAAYP